MPHNLEIRSALAPPRKRNRHPPVLFVHGAYCDAWCWDVHILPWFAAAGYDAFALSLRGHGRSPGGNGRALTLADYVEDIMQVVATMSARPVLVGHSMGATLVDRVIAQDAFPGAALVCPIPPSGLMASLTRLWWSRPDFFWQAQKLHSGALDPGTLSTLREFYFTPNASPEIIARAMRHMSPESPNAVMELAWHGGAATARVDGTPLQVIAAGGDVLFTPEEAHALARRHGTEATVLDGLPHMLMLEPGWEHLARTLDDWIKTSIPAPGARPARRSSPAQ